MKTYNTIEDILNDHDLMAKESSKILDELSSLDVLGTSLWHSIPKHPTSKTPRISWLKSEYERRQNKRYVRAVVTPPETKVTVEFMEKKPNLIPFDLEKAKAGAKVFVDEEHEAKIVFEELKRILVVFYHKSSKSNVSRWFYKNRYCGLSIESEPLPEMVSVEIPENISIIDFYTHLSQQELSSNNKLSDILKSFVKSLN